MADVFEESAESCQPLVAGLNRVAAVRFQRVQKAGYRIRTQVVETKLRDLPSGSFRGELQKQSHRIGVARDRVRPQPLLKFQMIVEE
jgi:hypothetical protein